MEIPSPRHGYVNEFEGAMKGRQLLRRNQLKQLGVTILPLSGHVPNIPENRPALELLSMHSPQ